MNFPTTVEQCMKDAESLDIEFTNDMVDFLIVFVECLNDAYYQGVADGMCFV